MQNVVNFLKKNGRDLLIIVLLLICIILIVCKYYLKDNKEVSNESIALVTETKKVEPVEEETIKTVYVDIKGAVKKPGVYQVASNSIINEVVTLAGGFNTNAYKNGINLSKKVSDEMVVYVYTKSEIAKINKDKDASTAASVVCQSENYDIKDCITEGSSIIETNPNVSNKNDSLDTAPKDNTTNQNSDSSSKLVNINTASLEELMTISGIGESKAKAIISYREENGNFKTIEDLMNVSGIGDKSFAKLKDYITV